MFKIAAKRILKMLGVKPHDLYRLYYEKLSKWSIKTCLRENKSWDLVERLRKIVPDISNQEESEKVNFNDYWELKRRGLQAFQCTLMLKALENFSFGNLNVVDIGDSAGTHMLYLKELTRGRFEIRTLSINIDPRAIEKIKARGLDARLCRAEKLDLGNEKVDLFTSFEMVEHLHNPSIFFRRLAKRPGHAKIVMTVPYLKKSRVGLYYIRNNRPDKNIISAEEEHIFELNSEDWALLMLHSGWKVIYSKIYYQYPKRWPIISGLLKLYWRTNDFEGFWGAILEKDLCFSERYKDWEN